jgi:hypothetical protein
MIGGEKLERPWSGNEPKSHRKKKPSQAVVAKLNF